MLRCSSLLERGTRGLLLPGGLLGSLWLLLFFFLTFFPLFLFILGCPSAASIPRSRWEPSPADCASRPKFPGICRCRVAAAQGLPSCPLPAWVWPRLSPKRRRGTCPHLGDALSLPWVCRPWGPARTLPPPGCAARAARHGLVATLRGGGAGVGPVAPPHPYSPPSERAGSARIPSWLRQRLPCPAWLCGGGSDPHCPLHFGAGGGWSQPQGRKRPNKPPPSPKSRIHQRDVRRAPPESWLPAQGRGAPAPFCPLPSRGSAWYKWGRSPEKRLQTPFFLFFKNPQQNKIHTRKTTTPQTTIKKFPYSLKFAH